MTQPQANRPRIYWFELARKWAIRTPPLPDERKAKLFIAELRQACSAVFHHGAQAWVVAESSLEAAKEIVAKYYVRYEFVERVKPKPEPPPRPVPHNPAYETFCALVGWSGPDRPSFTRARALYRRAAARMHPDVGGSADQMASLNVAWLAIKDTLASG